MSRGPPPATDAFQAALVTVTVDPLCVNVPDVVVQFGVGEPGRDADPGAGSVQLRCCLQRLVDPDVQCGGEGVQVGVHEASHEVDVG